MRPVMIVLLDTTGDAGRCFFQAAVLRRPDFLIRLGCDGTLRYFCASTETGGPGAGAKLRLAMRGDLLQEENALL